MEILSVGRSGLLQSAPLQTWRNGKPMEPAVSGIKQKQLP